MHDFYFVRANRVDNEIVYEVEGRVPALSPKQAAQKFCWAWSKIWQPTELIVMYHGDVWCFDNSEGFLREIEE